MRSYAKITQRFVAKFVFAFFILQWVSRIYANGRCLRPKSSLANFLAIEIVIICVYS